MYLTPITRYLLIICVFVLTSRATLCEHENEHFSFCSCKKDAVMPNLYSSSEFCSKVGSLLPKVRTNGNRTYAGYCKRDAAVTQDLNLFSYREVSAIGNYSNDVYFNVTSDNTYFKATYLASNGELMNDFGFFLYSWKNNTILNKSDSFFTDNYIFSHLNREMNECYNQHSYSLLFGPFFNGDTIAFYVTTDGHRGSNSPENNTHYTIQSLNERTYKHPATCVRLENTNSYLIAIDFEDSRGHRYYDYAGFLVSINFDIGNVSADAPLTYADGKLNVCFPMLGKDANDKDLQDLYFENYVYRLYVPRFPSHCAYGVRIGYPWSWAERNNHTIAAVSLGLETIWKDYARQGKKISLKSPIYEYQQVSSNPLNDNTYESNSHPNHESSSNPYHGCIWATCDSVLVLIRKLEKMQALSQCKDSELHVCSSTKGNMSLLPASVNISVPKLGKSRYMVPELELNLPSEPVINMAFFVGVARKTQTTKDIESVIQELLEESKFSAATISIYEYVPSSDKFYQLSAFTLPRERSESKKVTESFFDIGFPAETEDRPTSILEAAADVLKSVELHAYKAAIIITDRMWVGGQEESFISTIKKTGVSVGFFIPETMKKVVHNLVSGLPYAWYDSRLETESWLRSLYHRFLSGQYLARAYNQTQFYLADTSLDHLFEVESRLKSDGGKSHVLTPILNWKGGSQVISRPIVTHIIAPGWGSTLVNINSNKPPVGKNLQFNVSTTEYKIDFPVSDPDGDLVNIQIKSLPASGSLANVKTLDPILENQYIHYYPEGEVNEAVTSVIYRTGLNGVYFFTYVVSDGCEDSMTYTVSLTVDSMNTQIRAKNKTFTHWGYPRNHSLYIPFNMSSAIFDPNPHFPVIVKFLELPNPDVMGSLYDKQGNLITQSSYVKSTDDIYYSPATRTTVPPRVEKIATFYLVESNNVRNQSNYAYLHVSWKLEFLPPLLITSIPPSRNSSDQGATTITLGLTDTTASGGSLYLVPLDHTNGYVNISEKVHDLGPPNQEMLLAETEQNQKDVRYTFELFTENNTFRLKLYFVRKESPTYKLPDEVLNEFTATYSHLQISIEEALAELREINSVSNMLELYGPQFRKDLWLYKFTQRPNFSGKSKIVNNSMHFKLNGPFAEDPREAFELFYIMTWMPDFGALYTAENTRIHLGRPYRAQFAAPSAESVSKRVYVSVDVVFVPNLEILDTLNSAKNYSNRWEFRYIVYGLKTSFMDFCWDIYSAPYWWDFVPESRDQVVYTHDQIPVYVDVFVAALPKHPCYIMFMGAESLDLPQHKRLLLSIYATTSSSESPIDITKGGVIMKEPGIYTRICLTTVNAFSGDNSENKEYSLDVLYKCCNEVKCSGPYSMKIHISPGPAVPIAHDVNFYIGSAKMNEINVKRDREDRHDPETKIILLFYSDMNRNFYLNSSKNSIIDTTRQHVTLDSQTFYYRSNISSIENLDTPIDSLDYVISRSNLCYSNVAKIRIFRIHDIPDISEAALEQLESAREFSTIFSLVDKRILEPHGQEAKAVIKTLPNGALYQCIRDSDGVFPFNLPKIVQIDEKELPCTVSTASSLIYRPFVSSLHNYNNTFSYDLVNPVGNLLPKKLNIHITSINQPPRIIYITERFISSSQTSEFKLFWNIAELENPIHEHNMTLKLLDACETDEWKLFRCLDNICENVDMSPIPKQDSYLLKPSYTVERNCSYSEHLSEIMTLYPCRYAAYRYLFYPDPKLNRNCFYRLMLRVSNPVFESRSVNITLNALSTNKPPFIWVPPLIEFSYPVKELYIKSYKDEDLSYDKYAYVDDTDARSDCKKKLTVKVVHGAVENFRIISDVKICESPTTSSSTLECYGTTDELNSLFKDLRVIMKTDTVDIKFLLSNEGCVSTSNTSIDNVYISSVMTRIIYTRSADSHIPQASYIIAASFTVVFFVFVVFVYKKLQRYFSTPYFDVEREINMALLMHHSHESNPNSSISVDIQLSETDSDGHDFSM